MTPVIQRLATLDLSSGRNRKSRAKSRQNRMSGVKRNLSLDLNQSSIDVNPTPTTIPKVSNPSEAITSINQSDKTTVAE